MECNKEEALRAKEIAEQKMQNKDFVGAKKIAIKAQQLFAELDNISQMITVCEVHIRAGIKVSGEMDWYGILQVEQTADEASIKKQYRKLALVLHPDKNKFAGAEAAFKLIGEANMTLSDRGKRSVYDMKRRANIAAVMPRQQPSQQPNMSNFARKQPGVGNNFTSSSTFHYGNINTQQQPSGSNNQTFWTMCPNCCMKFQYFRALLNRSLRCHRCLTNYTASELNEQATPHPRENVTRPQNPDPNPKQEVPVQDRNFGNSSARASATNKREDGCHAKKEHVAKPPQSRKRGKKKRVVESSESECSTDSEEEEEEIAVEDGVNTEEHIAGMGSARYPKRSCRANQNVTYNERGNIEDDDDFASPRKRLKKGIPNNANNEESLRNGGESVNEKVEVSDTKGSPNVRSFSSPDSEFYDFEQERDPFKFAAEQIWAVYDELDAMPRFYARIREVVLDPFRLRFTWLEHNPLNEYEEVWTSEKLPVACGNYRLGKSETTKGLQMFSHLISWKKGAKRNTYDIYPTKGEVWALFKGWDAGWSSDANSHRLYEYEVVVVLSDPSENGDGFEIVHLVKVQGFVSLFVRSTDNAKSCIPLSDVFRFSHRVPSYRMRRGERDNVPEGALELDTASLPDNSGDTFPSVVLDTASVKAERQDIGDEKKSEKGDENENDTESNSVKHPSSPSMPSTSSAAFEYVQNDLHDFSEYRSIEKIQRGQIWALYSSINRYPNFYAKIKKVDAEDVVVSISWVELYPRGKEEEIWIEKEMPASCGRFKADQDTVNLDNIDTFSHVVHAEPTGKRDQFDIYPRKGEVWAIYKDWNAGWIRADLDKCEYHVVEILKVAHSSAKVCVLSKVANYTAVFMPEMKSTMEIPFSENLRFSHQIPAIRLKDEVGGALEGYWELDAASVPSSLLT